MPYQPYMGSGKGGTEGRPAGLGAVPDPVILEFRCRPPYGDADSTTAAERGDVIGAELARQLNATIYKVGLSLTDRKNEDFELRFFCACGCMTGVQRSLKDYVTRGAVVDGHSRPQGSVHR